MYSGEVTRTQRKVFHLVAASIIPTIYYFGPLPRAWVVWITAALAIIWVAADYMRTRSGDMNERFVRFFRVLLKRRESGAMTGSSYLVAGTAISLLAFNPPVAAAAVYFNAIGDPAAAVAGERLGSRRFANGKSLEGSSAMFITCVLLGAVILESWPVALAGAAAAALAELASNGRLDDNLSTPLVSGVAMTLTELWI